jgi:beta-barrel assembly-enhancing protease
MPVQPNALCFGDEFPASGVPCLVHVEDHGLTITFSPDHDGAEGQQGSGHSTSKAPM